MGKWEEKFAIIAVWAIMIFFLLLVGYRVVNGQIDVDVYPPGVFVDPNTGQIVDLNELTGIGDTAVTQSDITWFPEDTLKVEWGWYIWRWTMWGMMIEQETVEIGLREDGVVVWRRE